MFMYIKRIQRISFCSVKCTFAFCRTRGVCKKKLYFKISTFTGICCRQGKGKIMSTPFVLFHLRVTVFISIFVANLILHSENLGSRKEKKWRDVRTVYFNDSTYFWLNSSEEKVEDVKCLLFRLRNGFEVVNNFPDLKSWRLRIRSNKRWNFVTGENLIYNLFRLYNDEYYFNKIFFIKVFIDFTTYLNTNFRRCMSRLYVTS